MVCPGSSKQNLVLKYSNNLASALLNNEDVTGGHPALQGLRTALDLMIKDMEVRPERVLRINRIK